MTTLTNQQRALAISILADAATHMPAKGKSLREPTPTTPRHTGAPYRAVNPRRRARTALCRMFGITTGRQWKRLRNELRAHMMRGAQ